MVRHLVELHGGRIDIVSEGANRGTTVTVHLPVVVDEDMQPLEPDSNAPAVVTGLRILVVDDRKAAADMLGLILKQFGNDVRITYSGQAAVDIGAHFHPDAIIMDIGMPTQDGYETARQIRQQPWGQQIMLVALTGWGQDDDKRRTQEAGFDHHLIKPADPAELRKVLSAVKKLP